MCLRSAQEGHATAPEADVLLRLAVDHLRAGRVGLVLVGGPPATGKTSVAREFGAWRDWVVLRSHEVRKELAGIRPPRPPRRRSWPACTTPAMTSLTYGALLRRAQELLDRGESVVLDATWGDPVWRDEARCVAKLASADLAELRCAVPVAIAAKRAAHRQPDASDAGPDIAVELAERFARDLRPSSSTPEVHRSARPA